MFRASVLLVIFLVPLGYQLSMNLHILQVHLHMMCSNTAETHDHPECSSPEHRIAIEILQPSTSPESNYRIHTKIALKEMVLEEWFYLPKLFSKQKHLMFITNHNYHSQGFLTLPEKPPLV